MGGLSFHLQPLSGSGLGKNYQRMRNKVMVSNGRVSDLQTEQSTKSLQLGGTLRRCLDSAEHLDDKELYRPKTLELMADQLSKLDAVTLGVGPNGNLQANEDYFLQDVKPGDTLW